MLASLLALGCSSTPEAPRPFTSIYGGYSSSVVLSEYGMINSGHTKSEDYFKGTPGSMRVVWREHPGKELSRECAAFGMGIAVMDAEMISSERLFDMMANLEIAVPDSIDGVLAYHAIVQTSMKNGHPLDIYLAAIPVDGRTYYIALSDHSMFARGTTPYAEDSTRTRQFFDDFLATFDAE
jgi:hypothetical protein